MPHVVIRQVFPVTPRGYFVQWTVTDVPANSTARYSFTLEWSGGPLGPWTPVMSDVPDRYAYFDEIPQTGDPETNVRYNQFRIFQPIYYRVTARAGDFEDADIFEVGPKAQGKLSGFQRKMARDHRIMLRKYTGTPAALFKRRVWGERCPKCFDRKTQASTRGSCGTCFGTSFTGGYWDPVLVMARRQVAEQGEGTRHPKGDDLAVMIMLPDMPQVDNGDLIVFMLDNQRFEIDGFRRPLIQLEPTMQLAPAKELEHSNNVYSIRADPHSVHPLF